MPWGLPWGLRLSGRLWGSVREGAGWDGARWSRPDG